ncbi:glycosyltransferase [Amycolatopsis sp. H20-H5]|uniref:glycosyltransferase n=1 Tax=Amycolatopsis sp. H20-H5 TaxID=3046309 RepID=UPI002DB864C2|nr:nucleotide disphospho-sugar-binding domain-containing protein [Amycolatopsis sp. H20-H5]MEC3978866.1 nucleotide disphospho-sugar-binding domain-containing protein [Amycolatopsis sp. H20-H5]
MADYLFVPYGAHGHVNPMLPVVAELVTRGDRVRVLLSGHRFAAAFAGAGAEPVVSWRGHDVRVAAERSPREAVAWVHNRVRRRRAWFDASRRSAEEFRERRPDLVVADPMAPWASRLARRWELPVVPFWTTHARSPTGVGPALVNALPEFQPRPHRFSARFRFVGPLIAPVDADPGPSWAGSGPALLVSPGTVFTRSPGFFTAVARAFAGTDWTVLMATAHTSPRELGSLPPNVLARHWLPQRALLPRVDVFLTHGGMNSVQEALLHGVRMLVVPRSREQRHTARRLDGLDLARGWDLRAPLGAAVDRLLADGAVRSATGAMRQRLAAHPAASLAADVLQQAVSAHGRC